MVVRVAEVIAALALPYSTKYVVVLSLVVVLRPKEKDPEYQLFCKLVMTKAALVNEAELVMLICNTWVDCLTQRTDMPAVVVLQTKPVLRATSAGMVSRTVSPE